MKPKTITYGWPDAILTVSIEQHEVMIRFASDTNRFWEMLRFLAELHPDTRDKAIRFAEMSNSKLEGKA